MTKTDTLKKLAEVTGLAHKDVRAVLDSLMGTSPSKGVIAAALKRGQKVVIAGFGTFYVRQRSSRSARNPRTGGRVKVPKRLYPAFKPAKRMKDALRK
jgi:DNA-binding protein HU-beta